ncbi:MAG: CoA transferase [Spirochaetales bacterium]|nr:CoA transferase [Spirochaetales bacterium]
MKKALEGIKIVDLSHVLAAPFCTMILADMGADVVKVEPPIGDDSRMFGPFITEEDGKEKQSGYFISINRNKRSICVDLKKEEGKEILREMIKDADVVVENYRPTTMRKLGFSYDELKKINPGVIYCSICGFGQDALPEYAQRPAYDMIAQAFSGIMSITGPVGGPPVRIGSSVGDIVAGHQGAIGILAALNYKRTTGEGQHVDISMADGLFYILENAIVRYTIDGDVPQPLGSAHPAITPFQGFESKDNSWIIVAAGNDALWEKFCNAIDREDLKDHELYKTNPLRTKNKPSLIPILEVEMKKKTTDEWIKLLDESGVPNSSLNTIDKAVADPNLKYRNMVVEVDQPKVGKITMAGSPFHLSETPGNVRTPAPLLGQHTAAFLESELGYSKEKIEKLFEGGVVFGEK